MIDLYRNSTNSQRAFFAGLLLVFTFVSVEYHHKAAKGKSAISRWSTQIISMEDGEDVHKTHSYPNPPIMAMLLWPIAELIQVNPMAGVFTWFYLKVVMAIFCVLWVFFLVEDPGKPFPAWAKALTVVLSIRPIIGDLMHGNVNIFILFLVIGSLLAFARGRDILAGVLLALAIACKVTPAWFIGYFIWKRAWRVLGGTGIGLVLFFIFVPALFLGWEHNLQSLRSWFEVMILPFVVGGVVTPEHNNQSLPGLIARLLTSAPSFSTYIGEPYVPLRYDNIADIGPAAAKWLVKGFMGLFVLLVVWRCRTPIAIEGKSTTEARSGSRLATEYSLILVGMLLFSERTWKHHCVMLLLPFAVLSYNLAMRPMSRLGKRCVLGAMLLSFALIMTTATAIYGENLNRLQDQATATSFAIGPAGLTAATQSGIYTHSPAKKAQVYGAYVWAFFLLIGTLAVQLRRIERADPASGEKPADLKRAA